MLSTEHLPMLFSEHLMLKIRDSVNIYAEETEGRKKGMKER